MISPEYDFDKFLKAMAQMDYYEILVKAAKECGTAERRSYVDLKVTWIPSHRLTAKLRRNVQFVHRLDDNA
jgi:hypothetical protein